MTQAEHMLDHARSILSPKSELCRIANGRLLKTSKDTELFLARLKFCLDLYRAAPSVKFRAIMENWDVERIGRELY